MTVHAPILAPTAPTSQIPKRRQAAGQGGAVIKVGMARSARLGDAAPLREKRVIDDARSPLAIALHESEDYRLPATTLRGMTAELLARPMVSQDRDLYLSWDIRMNYRWRQDGRHDAGPENLRIHDARWRAHLDENPQIFHEACEKALSPWIDDDVDLLSLDGQLVCRFELRRPCLEDLVLTSFSGSSMAFRQRSDWADHLASLTPGAISDLWMATRILDTDLSRRQRADAMNYEYSLDRHELEADWSNEVDGLRF